MAVQWEPLGASKAAFPDSGAPYAATLYLFRSKVPGGWLLLTMTGGNDSSVSFYPDPLHSWDGSSMEGHELRSRSSRPLRRRKSDKPTRLSSRRIHRRPLPEPDFDLPPLTRL